MGKYCEGNTDEAKFAKGIDKIETILQHIQGDNPADFNYLFNLEYGKDCTSKIEMLSEMRMLIDHETEKKMRLVNE